MCRVDFLIQTAKGFGVRAALLRSWYELERRSGILTRRLRSAGGWDFWSVERVAPGADASRLLADRRAGARPFLFEPRARARTRRAAAMDSLLNLEQQRTLLERADEIVHGRLPYFGRHYHQVGLPPDWWRNIDTGQRVDASRPWTELRFDDPQTGDLKLILEPSRFLWVYPLARAYELSGDSRYPKAFWAAVDSWYDGNPPMLGPLWICGQESALRVLAWTFGLYAFLHDPETTPERFGRLLSLLTAHAGRIEQTLSYARSQRNNHLISEAVGLWTVGALFPEAAAAERWKGAGRRLFKEAVLDQFESSGAYAQHSFNYQRMALQLAAWMLALGRRHGERPPAAVVSRLNASYELLRKMVDPATGRAPNYGSNDGALVLPLASGEFTDYRPALRMVAHTLNLPTPYPAGPWDEAPLWLGGPQPDGSERSEADSAKPPPESGYVVLGDRTSWGMVRCARYRSRPSQADQLHVDLWWRGINIARDPGSYLYNADPPWDNGLARTGVHNTVSLGGRDQMQRAGRFLWLHWAQARIRGLELTPDAQWDRFQGEHDGYAGEGVVHRRAVSRLGDYGWLVVDDLVGTGSKRGQLHWLLPDEEIEVTKGDWLQVMLRTSAGRVQWHIAASTVLAAHHVRAGEAHSAHPPPPDALTELRGWESPTYAELRPALSLICEAIGELPLRFVTLIALEGVHCTRVDPHEGVRLHGPDGELEVALSPLECDTRTDWLIHNARGAAAERPHSSN